MNIDVKVIPGAKRNAVRQEGDLWKIYLPLGNKIS